MRQVLGCPCSNRKVHLIPSIGPEIGLGLIVVAVDINALNALPEHGRVPILILQIDVQTPGKVGCGVVDPSYLVALVDSAVLNHIRIANWPSPATS